MKTLPPSPFEEVKPFTRFFGIAGVEIRIRRRGHPLAQDPEVEARATMRGAETIQAIEEARRRAAKADGERKPESFTVRQLLDVDKEFRERYVQRAAEDAAAEAEEREAEAARHVAGWSGDAFDEGELPKNGAFDLEAVLSAIFRPHGEFDEGPIIPAFEDEKSGGTVLNFELAQRGAAILAEETAALDAAFKKAQDGKAKDDDTGVWLRWYEEESEKVLAELKTDEKLQKIGLRRAPCAGLPLREAMAKQILLYADEVDKAWRAAMGFLVESSPRKGGSGRSTPSRTRTKRGKRR